MALEALREEESFLNRLDGRHLLATLAIAIAAGFLAVYIDSWLISPVEQAVGVQATQY